MHGVAEIIVYIQLGVDQYNKWSETAETDSKAPAEGWLNGLVRAELEEVDVGSVRRIVGTAGQHAARLRPRSE